MRKRCVICGNIFGGLPDENVCEDCLLVEELRANDIWGEPLNIGVNI
jgi:hypothetical protein